MGRGGGGSGAVSCCFSIGCHELDEEGPPKYSSLTGNIGFMIKINEEL